MKADLAIYSYAVDASGQCMSESLKLGNNLDFSSCDILIGFVHKSSHKYLMECDYLMLCKNSGAIHLVQLGLTEGWLVDNKYG